MGWDPYLPDQVKGWWADGYPLSLNRIPDACKNITFLRTTYVLGSNHHQIIPVPISISNNKCGEGQFSFIKTSSAVDKPRLI